MCSALLIAEPKQGSISSRPERAIPKKSHTTVLITSAVLQPHQSISQPKIPHFRHLARDSRIGKDRIITGALPPSCNTHIRNLMAFRPQEYWPTGPPPSLGHYYKTHTWLFLPTISINILLGSIKTEKIICKYKVTGGISVVQQPFPHPSHKYDFFFFTFFDNCRSNSYFISENTSKLQKTRNVLFLFFSWGPSRTIFAKSYIGWRLKYGDEMHEFSRSSYR